ncbi:LacI family transcriptional regulator [Ruminococcaceae bacterium OttesenSCG-928-L11]|nr:LacI family transcriptional regulator [Ruminococcaceae bacterium OttesenSCG-928-L11]
MHRKATLKDVSTLAGVSQATASYVLNGNLKQKISEATRKRVMEAARQLNYMPNNTAKSLKSNRTYCIGVAIDKAITIPRYSQTLQGIRHVLEKDHYHIIMNSTKKLNGGEYPDFLNSYFAHQVDGVIYIAADNKNMEEESENTVVQYRIPLVAMDCSSENRRISTVDIDYFHGAYETAEFLHTKRGVRKLFFFRPNLDTRQEREREQGIRRAEVSFPDLQVQVLTLDFLYEGANLQLYQLAFNERDKLQFNDMARAVNEAMQSIDGELDEESGVICSWAGMEQFVLPHLINRKDEVKVAVLAQGLFHSAVYPNLYYSHLPNYAAGSECAKMVLDLLKDPEDIRHNFMAPSVQVHDEE